MSDVSKCRQPATNLHGVTFRVARIGLQQVLWCFEGDKHKCNTHQAPSLGNTPLHSFTGHEGP
jgi:hypothetical protein